MKRKLIKFINEHSTWLKLYARWLHTKFTIHNFFDIFYLPLLLEVINIYLGIFVIVISPFLVWGYFIYKAFCHSDFVGTWTIIIPIIMIIYFLCGSLIMKHHEKKDNEYLRHEDKKVEKMNKNN